MLGISHSANHYDSFLGHYISDVSMKHECRQPLSALAGDIDSLDMPQEGQNLSSKQTGVKRSLKLELLMLTQLELISSVEMSMKANPSPLPPTWEEKKLQQQNNTEFWLSSDFSLSLCLSVPQYTRLSVLF